MHEFSLATNIIEIAENAAKNANKETITSITLQIGEISGVETEALYTALKSLMHTPMFSRAKIITRIIPGRAKCAECNSEFDLSDMFTLCPNCKSYFKDIVAGKEFNVLAIEAE